MAQDNHQGNGFAMESGGALEPQALHFADVQLLANPGSHPQVCCTFNPFSHILGHENVCMVDQWSGRKVLEKSFYDVQRFAGEGIEVCHAMHRIGHQKLSLAQALSGKSAPSSRGKEHCQALDGQTNLN